MGDFLVIPCLNCIKITQKQAWRSIYFAWMKSMYFREYVCRFSRKLHYFCILGVSHFKACEVTPTSRIRSRPNWILSPGPNSGSTGISWSRGPENGVARWLWPNWEIYSQNDHFGLVYVMISVFTKIIGHIGHFRWLGPNVWWEISLIWIEHIKPIGQMSDEPWKFFGYTVIYKFLGMEANNYKFGMFCQQCHPSMALGDADTQPRNASRIHTCHLFTLQFCLYLPFGEPGRQILWVNFPNYCSG